MRFVLVSTAVGGGYIVTITLLTQEYGLQDRVEDEKVKKLAIIMMATLFFSCSKEIPNEKSFDFHEFHTRRAAWEKLGMDHYRFEFTTNHTAVRDTFTHSRITVFPDRVPEIVVFYQGTNWSRPEPFTIEQRFEWVYNFARNPPDDRHYILVWYNGDYHFPETIHIRLISLPGFENGGGFYKDRITVFEDLRSR